jgi:hypothetical protein
MQNITTVQEDFDKVWNEILDTGKQQPAINGVEVWVRPEMKCVSRIDMYREPNGKRDIVTRYVNVSIGADGQYEFHKGSEGTLKLLSSVIKFEFNNPSAKKKP